MNTDKSGKLLAWPIQKEDSSRCIPSVKINDGVSVVHNPKLINSQGVDTHKMNNLLAGLTIPGLTVETRDSLEADISNRKF